MGVFDLTPLEQKHAAQQPQPAPVETESQFSRGLRSGALGIKGQLHALAGGVGDAFGGNDFAAEQFAASQAAQQEANAAAPRVTNFRDVHGLGDAWDYATGMMGQSIPTSAAALGGALLARGGALRSALGATMATAPMEVGEALQRQQTDPALMQSTDAGQRLRTAGLEGLASAGVQSVVPAMVAGQFARPVARKGLGDAIRANLIDIPLEGLTEAGGVKAHQIGQSYLNQGRDTSGDTEELLQAGVGGMVGGAGFSAAGTGADVAGSVLGAPNKLYQKGKEALAARRKGGQDARTEAPEGPNTYDAADDGLAAVLESLKGKAGKANAYFAQKAPELHAGLADAVDWLRKPVEEQIGAAQQIWDDIRDADDIPEAIRAKASAAAGKAQDAASRAYLFTLDAMRRAKTKVEETQAAQQAKQAYESAAAKARDLFGAKAGEDEDAHIIRAMAAGEDVGVDPNDPPELIAQKLKASDDTMAAKAKQWGEEMLAKARSPEVKAAIKKALENIGDKGAHSVIGGYKQAERGYKKLMESLRAAADDLTRKPREPFRARDVGDVTDVEDTYREPQRLLTKQSRVGQGDLGEGASDAVRGIAPKLASHVLEQAERRYPGISEDPDRINRVGEVLRGVLEHATQGKPIPETTHEFLFNLLGERETTNTLRAMYSAISQSPNKEQDETFFKSLADIDNAERRTGNMERLVRDSLVPSYQRNMDLDGREAVKNIRSWVAQRGSPHVTAAQRHFDDEQMRETMAHYFGDKADAVLAAFDKEYQQSKPRTMKDLGEGDREDQYEGTVKEGVDKLAEQDADFHMWGSGKKPRRPGQTLSVDWLIPSPEAHASMYKTQAKTNVDKRLYEILGDKYPGEMVLQKSVSEIMKRSRHRELRALIKQHLEENPEIDAANATIGDLFRKEGEDAGQAQTIIDRMKKKHPERKVRFMTVDEILHRNGNAFGKDSDIDAYRGKALGAVVVEGLPSTSEDVNESDIARMKADTRYKNSRQLFKDSHGELLDAKRIIRVMENKLERDTTDKTTGLRKARAFMAGVGAYMDRTNQTFDIPNDTVIYYNGKEPVTFGAVKKMDFTPAPTYEYDPDDDMSNSRKAEVIDSGQETRQGLDTGKDKRDDAERAAYAARKKVEAGSDGEAKAALQEADNLVAQLVDYGPTEGKSAMYWIKTAQGRIDELEKMREMQADRYAKLDPEKKAGAKGDHERIIKGIEQRVASLNRTIERIKRADQKSMEPNQGTGRTEVGHDDQIHITAATHGENQFNENTDENPLRLSVDEAGLPISHFGPKNTFNSRAVITRNEKGQAVKTEYKSTSITENGRRVLDSRGATMERGIPAIRNQGHVLRWLAKQDLSNEDAQELYTATGAISKSASERVVAEARANRTQVLMKLFKKYGGDMSILERYPGAKKAAAAAAPEAAAAAPEVAAQAKKQEVLLTKARSFDAGLVKQINEHTEPKSLQRSVEFLNEKLKEGGLKKAEAKNVERMVEVFNRRIDALVKADPALAYGMRTSKKSLVGKDTYERSKTTFSDARYAFSWNKPVGPLKRAQFAVRRDYDGSFEMRVIDLSEEHDRGDRTVMLFEYYKNDDGTWAIGVDGPAPGSPMFDRFRDKLDVVPVSDGDEYTKFKSGVFSVSDVRKMMRTFRELATELGADFSNVEITRDTGANPTDAGRTRDGRKFSLVSDVIHQKLGKRGIAAAHDSPHRFDGRFNWRAKGMTGEGQMTHGAGTYLSTATAESAFYKKQFTAMNAERGKGAAPTYHVTIDAHPDEFLDWNEQLKHQSPFVRGALDGYGFADSMSGDEVYRHFSQQFGGDVAASDFLHALGIVGAVHSGDKGGRNYVVFDDSRIDTNWVQFSKVNGGAQILTDAEREEVGDWIKKVLAGKVEANIMDMPFAGEFIKTFGAEGMINLSHKYWFGDPMGAARHEALHAMIHQLEHYGQKDVTRELLKAASTGHVQKQLRELLKNQPAALDQLSDPEERAAYMFQFYASGKLTINDKSARTIIQRIMDLINRVFGIWTAEENAERILDYFNSGEYAANIDKRDAVLDVARGPKRDSFVKGAQDIGRQVMELSSSVVSSGQARMRDTGIPALIELADKVKRLSTKAGGDAGFIPAARIARTEWMNKLAQAVDGTTPEQLDDAMKALQQGDYKQATTPEARVVAWSINKLLREMKQYMDEAGVQIGDLGTNYFPRVWDAVHISKHLSAFEDMLEKYVESGDLDKRGKANVVNRLMVTDGSEIMRETTRPGMVHGKKRDLDFISGVDAEPFLQKDLLRTLDSYITQATRRAEWARRFDDNGKALKDLIERARVEGATDEQVAMVDKYLKGIDGTLGDNMDPRMRRLMGDLLVYQNVRLLPLMVFSSFVDPLGIAVRGGALKDSFRTAVRGFREMVTSFKDDPQRDEMYEIAALMGTIDNAMLTHVTGQLYQQGLAGDTARKINDTFFRWNLMEQFNVSMRVGATEAALNFIAKHADRTASEHSERWMEELGLQPQDVLIVNGRPALTVAEYEAAGVSHDLAVQRAAKVKAAVNMWVDGAVLRPDAADVPVWFNDPRWMLVSHLKKFVYSFQHTILDRALHEIDNANLRPALVLMGYVPVMIVADLIKSLLQGGGELPEWKKKWGAWDYVWSGVQRAGLLGTGQFTEDGIGGVVGPTVEQAMDAMNVSDGKMRFGKFVVEAMPANSLYKNWTSTDVQGAEPSVQR